MKRLFCLFIALLIAPVVYSQYVVDSTYYITTFTDTAGVVHVISPTNQWTTPPLSQLQLLYEIRYQDQVKADTLRIRPNQYFSTLFLNAPFTVKLDSVIGAGNLRRSYWSVTWQKDSINYLNNFYLSYTMFGEADPCGVVKVPSDSVYRAYTAAYQFREDSLNLRMFRIEPITIAGSVSTKNVLVLIKIKHYQIPNWGVPVDSTVQLIKRIQ